MAKLKDIKGTNIQFLDSDPVPGIAGWASGGNMNTARYALAGTGTQTAALGTGGRTPSYTGVTESYDGSSWTEVNDLNTGRGYLAMSGTNTAALAFGGVTPPS